MYTIGNLVRSDVEDVVRTYTYFDGNLDAIFDDAGDLVLRFIYGPELDWVVAAQDDAGNYYGYQLDASNSVRRIKDAGGAVVAEYEYDFWGNPLSETESIEQPLRFQGRLWFPELGLYNFRARWYDPSLGRFLSEDSYWPAQPHPYAFVGSDPLNYVDPTGDVLGAIAGMGTVTDALGGLQHWADLNKCMCAAEAYQQWSRDMLRLAGTTVVFAVVGGVAFRTAGGAVRGGRVPRSGQRTVIGKVKDLRELRPGENTLLKHLPNRGIPKANWKQNDGSSAEKWVRDAPYGMRASTRLEDSWTIQEVSSMRRETSFETEDGPTTQLLTSGVRRIETTTC